MITTWAIMIGRDRDFNHVEDIGRQYYVLKLVEFQTFANRNFHYIQVNNYEIVVNFLHISHNLT